MLFGEGTQGNLINTINLKSDLPSVHEALQRLEHEITDARRKKISFLKVVHGYGSTSAGGDIRIAVQRRLLELTEAGQIQGCVFGEHWSKSDENAWRLLQRHAELKGDPDLGRKNQGITVVIL